MNDLTRSESRIFFLLDVLFAACVGIAILTIIGLTGCSRPLPDLGKVLRGQVSREVHSGSDTCRAWLPLIVRSEAGQGELALALQAAQPWADAIGFAVAVPALDGEVPTVTIDFVGCPADKALKSAPWCSAFATTSGHCDSGVYYQRIDFYLPGDAVSDFFVLMHELGHALGVFGGTEHSDDASSIMYATVRPPALMAGDAGPEVSAKPGAPVQWVRDADAASLRAVWGGAAK